MKLSRPNLQLPAGHPLKSLHRVQLVKLGRENLKREQQTTQLKEIEEDGRENKHAKNRSYQLKESHPSGTEVRNKDIDSSRS
jgi:hypothetical protein